MVDWVVWSKFINVGIIIFLGGLSRCHSLGGSFFAQAHFVEMSYFVTLLTLGILCRTLLPWLVFTFSTPHALAFQPWGFSRLMFRIRRSLLSRFILSPWFSISCVSLVLASLVLPVVKQNKVHRGCGIKLAQTLMMRVAIFYF